ncbi:cysteine dioxygenase type 1-like [Daphnia pulex]|uniref:cysteine dioxygenase type 1-like n=1 Tax=Daphnia pulex TaxID=6669 RepID=UPI001EE101AB|nr:cysteine dioxygenase type 1-like [Daphnia pulex]
MAYNVATLDELIAELHKAFESDSVDVDHVTQLMQSYKSNPADWGKFAKFDRYRYTRNLVDEGNGKFNLMLLCWGEGHSSAVHDHADAHCFMKMLDGTLKEVRFAWPSDGNNSSPATTESGAGDAQELQTTGSTLLEVNGVCYINDSLGLHRVENPSHVDRSVSLHLYSPPFDTCHMFDQRTGKKTAAKVTFWSKFGERVPSTVVPHSCSIPKVTEGSSATAATTN